ncbi:NAD(P)-binding domain [Cordyceps militaris]|uniref:NAD(P)-binding domain n=1 Tax=Cordyceps militaris TaxID=73501 RepID=A0A2H4SLQ5_CORMI|nr:NAD(P)-binding domain [Cordyceps militaris]
MGQNVRRQRHGHPQSHTNIRASASTVQDQGRAPALADAVWCSPEMMGKTYGPGPPPPAEWCMGNAIGLDLVGYRSSKSPENRMMLAWYWNLKNIGVKVWRVLSGSLATNLGGSGGSVDWGRADQKGD